MVNDENGGGEGYQRQMYQGNWQCGSCGSAITELPFEPKEDRLDELKCRDCFQKNRGGGQGRDRGERQMYQGNWQCSMCGGAITQLPFQPAPGREDGLKCLDCFKKN